MEFDCEFVEFILTRPEYIEDGVLFPSEQISYLSRDVRYKVCSHAFVSPKCEWICPDAIIRKRSKRLRTGSCREWFCCDLIEPIADVVSSECHDSIDWLAFRIYVERLQISLLIVCAGDDPAFLDVREEPSSDRILEFAFVYAVPFFCHYAADAVDQSSEAVGCEACFCFFK